MFRSRSRATWGVFFPSGDRGVGGGFLRGKKAVVHPLLFPFQLERAKDRQRYEGNATSVRGPRRSVGLRACPFSHS